MAYSWWTGARARWLGAVGRSPEAPEEGTGNAASPCHSGDMPKFARIVSVTTPGERFPQALELIHAAARMYDGLAELESAYHLVDRQKSQYVFVGLYESEADLDATRKGAQDQISAANALLGGHTDFFHEMEVVDENH